MRRPLYLLLVLSLLSCQKQKSKAEYMQDALKSDRYKNASMNIRRVKDILDSVKKGKLDTTAAIFVYNNSIATPSTQVKTVAQVEEGMKNDTALLKAAQLKAAAELASADSLKNNR